MGRHADKRVARRFGRVAVATARMRVAGMALAAALTLLAACGGGSSESPSTDDCGGVIGMQAPPCTCTSWTNHVIPTSELLSGGVPVLIPDWSGFPPRADVKAGQRVSVSAVTIGKRPFDCNQGYTSNSVVWSSTDRSVLSLESVGTGARQDASFVAAAPGTATVAADSLLMPGGLVGRAELTVCNRGATGSLQDGFVCADRVPLVIRVVP